MVSKRDGRKKSGELCGALNHPASLPDPSANGSMKSLPRMSRETILPMTNEFVRVESLARSSPSDTETHLVLDVQTVRSRDFLLPACPASGRPACRPQQGRLRLRPLSRSSQTPSSLTPTPTPAMSLPLSPSVRLPAVQQSSRCPDSRPPMARSLVGPRPLQLPLRPRTSPRSQSLSQSRSASQPLHSSVRPVDDPSTDHSVDPAPSSPECQTGATASLATPLGARQPSPTSALASAPVRGSSLRSMSAPARRSLPGASLVSFLSQTPFPGP